MLKNYVEVFRKYAVFSGRAGRREYWLFYLANVIISFLLSFVEGASGTASSPDTSVLSSFYALAVFLPGLAVAVRRMHDIGKSGWYILIPIYNIVLLATKGEGGINKYGMNITGSADAEVSPSATASSTEVWSVAATTAGVPTSATASATPGELKCPECGKKQLAGGTFCAHCGCPLQTVTG